MPRFRFGASHPYSSNAADWLKGLLLVLISSSGISVAIAQEEQATSADLSSLEGWWRFNEDATAFANGCADEDNKYRVAIGRWQRDENSGAIEFRRGEDQRIGLYDGGCTLKSGERKGNALVFSSECSSEGEELNGLTVINIVSQNKIEIISPVTSATSLIRCSEKEQSASGSVITNSVHTAQTSYVPNASADASSTHMAEYPAKSALETAFLEAVPSTKSAEQSEPANPTSNMMQMVAQASQSVMAHFFSESTPRSTSSASDFDKSATAESLTIKGLHLGMSRNEFTRSLESLRESNQSHIKDVMIFNGLATTVLGNSQVQEPMKRLCPITESAPGEIEFRCKESMTFVSGSFENDKLNSFYVNDWLFRPTSRSESVDIHVFYENFISAYKLTRYFENILTGEELHALAMSDKLNSMPGLELPEKVFSYYESVGSSVCLSAPFPLDCSNAQIGLRLTTSGPMPDKEGFRIFKILTPNQKLQAIKDAQMNEQESVRKLRSRFD